jgi:hypothetical protein
LPAARGVIEQDRGRTRLVYAVEGKVKIAMRFCEMWETAVKRKTWEVKMFLAG